MERAREPYVRFANVILIGDCCLSANADVSATGPKRGGDGIVWKKAAFCDAQQEGGTVGLESGREL